MPSKFVEPQLAAESFSCPHCNAFAHQWWYRLYLKGTKNGSELKTLSIEKINPRRDFKILDEDDRKRAESFVKRLEKNFVTFRTQRHNEYLAGEMINLHLSRCFACDGFAVWVADRLVYPVRKGEIIAHEEMPSVIRDDFDEAAAIVDVSPEERPRC